MWVRSGTCVCVCVWWPGRQGRLGLPWCQWYQAIEICNSFAAVLRRLLKLVQLPPALEEPWSLHELRMYYICMCVRITQNKCHLSGNIMGEPGRSDRSTIGQTDSLNDDKICGLENVIYRFGFFLFIYLGSFIVARCQLISRWRAKAATCFLE